MKKFVSIFLFAVISLFFFHSGCKTSLNQYTLTVILGEGITGNLPSGTYTLEQNRMVYYDYYITGAYANPMVLLNGENAPMKRIITMDRDYTLEITCDKIDVSGEWMASYRWERRPNSVAVCGLLRDTDFEEISIEISGESLTFVMPSLGLVLKGAFSDRGLFSVMCTKQDTVGFLYEYNISGSFVSANDFEGSFQIVMWVMQGNEKLYGRCRDNSIISGAKK